MSVKEKGARFLQKLLAFFVILLALAAGWLIVVVSIAAAPTLTDLQVGDVSGQDVIAPHAISYESDVLTEERRESVQNSVSPRYTLADTSVARQQLDRLRSTLAYISSVRSDSYATYEQKLEDLARMDDLELSDEMASAILELSEARWQTVQQETINVLERVMRNTIRESQVDDYQRVVPNLVSLALPEDQAMIVAELAAALIAPNSFYSESLTETARQQAADAVEPEIVSYAANETVVRQGQLVTEAQIEALQHLGLAQPETQWQDYVGDALLVLIGAGLILIYLRRHPEFGGNIRKVLILVVLFISFLAGARFAIPQHEVLPYLFPMAAYALVVSALYSSELAIVSIVPLTLLSVFGHTAATELSVYYIVTSMYAVLIPKREQRITAYVWSGFTVAFIGAVVLLAYLLPGGEPEWQDLLRLAGLSILNGALVAGMSVLLQYLLSPLLGQITPLQLLELSRPDNPLLAYLMRNAPGTYQHSLQVANLAEQAAEAIGANSLLTRVGALYHDIGKTINPQFYIENQMADNIDTHDDLDPVDSAAMIIRHVTYGLELAEQNRLPRRIQDFIAEHHGDSITYYQWTQAVKEAGDKADELDKSLFQYPGPRPQSVETALVMLADGCEARIRAQRPEDEEALQEMIEDTVTKRVTGGQLDDTKLTLDDIDTTIKIFTATLRGIYHPRVEYPSLDVPTLPNPLFAWKPVELPPTDVFEPLRSLDGPEDGEEQ